MKYAIETHHLVFPKYAKMVFKIDQKGNLLVCASPSLTPGKMPPGMQNGQLPKGTKVFDYTKEIQFTLGFDDCLNIAEFSTLKQNCAMAAVNIFRKSATWNKKITFVYTPDDVNPAIAKMATIFFEMSRNNNTTKFYLSLSLKALDEIAEFCKSYAYSMISLKVSCGIEEERCEKEKEDSMLLQQILRTLKNTTKLDIIDDNTKVNDEYNTQDNINTKQDKQESPINEYSNLY